MLNSRHSCNFRFLMLYFYHTFSSYYHYLVYSSYCGGPCKCHSEFNGNDHLLLNLNNRYFIHYSLLYEYSEMMTVSRNPLYSYLK